MVLHQQSQIMKNLITTCILTVFGLSLQATAIYDTTPIHEPLCCEANSPHISSQALHVIPGDWQKGFVADDPYLTFAEDGTYTTTELSEAGYYVKTGRWTIANNEELLILYPNDGGVLVYTIKNLELDERVLSLEGEEDKDLYLSRI